MAYSWGGTANGRSPHYLSPCATYTKNLTAWTGTPAVHMPEVFAIADEKVQKITMNPALQNENKKVKSPTIVGTEAPNIKKQIPNQQATIGIAFQMSINVDTYFSNPEPSSIPRMTIHTITGLPPGLTSNCPQNKNTTCLITGTPTSETNSPYSISVTAHNRGGVSTPNTFKITVTGATHPPKYNTNRPIVFHAGETNKAYTPTIDASESFTGDKPMTFTSTGLPPGLTITSAGIISGTPTTAGTYSNIIITASNDDDKKHGSSPALTITITKPTPPPTNYPTLKCPTSDNRIYATDTDGHGYVFMPQSQQSPNKDGIPAHFIGANMNGNSLDCMYQRPNDSPMHYVHNFTYDIQYTKNAGATCNSKDRSTCTILIKRKD